MGLVALLHVGSSRTRDRTRVPCVGRRILNHCATRKVPTMPVWWQRFGYLKWIGFVPRERNQCRTRDKRYKYVRIICFYSRIILALTGLKCLPCARHCSKLVISKKNLEIVYSYCILWLSPIADEEPKVEVWRLRTCQDHMSTSRSMDVHSVRSQRPGSYLPHHATRKRADEEHVDGVGTP